VSRNERVEGCRLVLRRAGDGPPLALLVGELDRFDVEDLPRILRPFLVSEDAVLDLDEVSFVDLAGCRALLALVGPPDGVRVLASPGTPCGRLLAWLAAETHEDPDATSSELSPV
jgi:hypothetical protein